MRLRSSTRKSSSSSSIANSVDNLKTSSYENKNMIMDQNPGPVMSSTMQDTSYPYQKPIRGKELQKLTKIALLASAFAGFFLLSTFLLVQYDKIKLYPSSVNSELLNNFASKAEFTVKYQVLLVFWIIINIHIVIYYRITKGALNPLTQCTEHVAQASKSILVNSCEQILVSLFAQLIFIAHADGASVLRVIPWINLIQFIGRTTFFAGYPLYRTFGMMLTLLPNTLLTLYNVYRLGSFINIY